MCGSTGVSMTRTSAPSTVESGVRFFRVVAPRFGVVVPTHPVRAVSGTHPIGGPMVKNGTPSGGANGFNLLVENGLGRYERIDSYAFTPAERCIPYNSVDLGNVPVLRLSKPGSMLVTEPVKERIA